MSQPDEPQVSWKVIESGAHVLTSDGEEAATVTRVVGDADADVFTGIAVKTGVFGSELLIPSERVTGIWPERIEVSLTKAELEALPGYDEAPVVRLEPERPGFFSRLFGR